MQKRLTVVMVSASLGAAAFLFWAGALPLPADSPADRSPHTANPNDISPASSTHQQADLANWQRYTNEAYGYTFLYPPYLRLSTNVDLDLATTPVVYIGGITFAALDPQTVHPNASAVAEAYALPFEEYLRLVLSLNYGVMLFDVEGTPVSSFPILPAADTLIRYARVTPELNLPGTGNVPGSFLYAVTEGPEQLKIQIVYRDDPNVFIGTTVSILQTFKFTTPE